MRNKRLFEVSLPTNNERKIINCVNESQRDNNDKARILAHFNTLVLAQNDMERYQLYALMLKDYILNRCNGKVKNNIELDEIIDSIGFENIDTVKDNLCALIQYLYVDNETRYALSSNYVNNLASNNIRYQGIKRSDEGKCILLCDILNKVIETKIQKKECKVYTRVSSR